MGKQRKGTKRNPVSLAADGLRLVVDRKPDDVRFAVGSQSGSGPASRGARGLRPVGESVFKVVGRLARVHHTKTATEDDR